MTEQIKYDLDNPDYYENRNLWLNLTTVCILLIQNLIRIIGFQALDV